VSRRRGASSPRRGGWPPFFKSFDDRHLQPPAPLTDEQRALIAMTPEECAALDEQEAQRATDQKDDHD
jgi:hypothetical protein